MTNPTISPTLDSATVNSARWLVNTLRTDGFSVDFTAEYVAEYLADQVARYGVTSS